MDDKEVSYETKSAATKAYQERLKKLQAEADEKARNEGAKTDSAKPAQSDHPFRAPGAQPRDGSANWKSDRSDGGPNRQPDRGEAQPEPQPLYPRVDPSAGDHPGARLHDADRVRQVVDPKTGKMVEVEDQEREPARIVPPHAPYPAPAGASVTRVQPPLGVRADEVKPGDPVYPKPDEGEPAQPSPADRLRLLYEHMVEQQRHNAPMSPWMMRELGEIVGEMRPKDGSRTDYGHWTARDQRTHDEKYGNADALKQRQAAINQDHDDRSLAEMQERRLASDRDRNLSPARVGE
jgi:hypothetical protein